MANIKDFAVGIVVTAPSPSTSGTTATLRPGEGATMATPPFYATATPPGQLTTVGTSEKILVTAVDTATDIITFTRAQGPTSAKSIAAGWIIVNAVYADDVFSSSIVIDETLSGTINGTNKVFTTAAAFTSILVFKNGLTMRKGGSNDFTITGTNQITFVTAPATGTVLTATYIIGSQVMINGSNSLVTDEVPTGTINGTNKTFTVARAYVGASLEVFVNGLKQRRVVHFTENPTAATFTLDEAPLTGDDIMVNYQYVLAASANADTVDGVHANTTPTPNMLQPLDSNGKIPISTQQPINKKLNTTSSVLSSPIIQTGVAGIVNGATVTVTYPVPFNSVPIPVINGVGGNASSSAFAYPAATASAFNDRVWSTGNHTTTGFTAYISGATVGASQIAEFAWIAVGD